MSVSNDCCRLCSDANNYCNSSGFIDLCTIKINGVDSEVVIQELFHFKVQPMDNLPTVICSNCLNCLQYYYNFYVKVKSVQSNFNKTVIKRKKDKVKSKSFRSSSNSEMIDILESSSQIPKVKEESIVDDQHSLTLNTSVVIKSENDPLESQLEIKNEFMYEMSVEVNTNKKAFKKENKLKKVQNKTEEDISIDNQSDVSVRNEESLSDSDNSVYLAENKSCAETKSFEGFPDTIHKDGKLAVTGPALDKLLRKFYNIHCDLCQNKPEFTTCFILFQHYLKVHNVPGYVTCCKRKLTTRKIIIYHMISHVWPTAFKCELCNRAFPYYERLRIHITSMHLPDSVKDFKCDECNKGFATAHYLKIHKSTHIPMEKRETIHCDKCNKMFKGVRSFRCHMHNMHKVEICICPTCGKSFKSRASLKVHLLTHDPQNQVYYKCDQCHSISRSRSALRAHKKRHLSDRFQCTLCDYNTNMLNYLKSHMKIKHSDDRPFTCVICKKNFKKKQALEGHMSQHTGQHNYSCDFCPRTFASNGNFYKHRKSMHPEQHKELLRSKRLAAIMKISEDDNNDSGEIIKHIQSSTSIAI